ncbi:hypothetical protein RCZ04_00860 [Capnocytophaga sp. HP1101]
MKNHFLNLFTLAVATIAFTGALSAQNTAEQRLSREELATIQAKNIANELALSDSATKQFIETFSQCQKELWALRPEKKTASPTDTMTEEQAKKAIQEQFEYSQKILDIRKHYYAKYSKFLTQKQIKRVYELEKKAMNRFQERNFYLIKQREAVIHQRMNERKKLIEERKRQIEERNKQRAERIQ